MRSQWINMAKPLYKMELDGPHNLIGALLILSGVYYLWDDG